MNTLTKNRILQKGDEYRLNGEWKPVPKDDFGLQVMFSKYTEVRRPSEKPTPILPDERIMPSGEIAKRISPDSEKHESLSPKGDSDSSPVVTAKAEADRVPASGVSPAGGESLTPAARIELVLPDGTRIEEPQPVSYLPTVVSKKAHKRGTSDYLPDPTETPEHVQKRDRIIIENIPYDLPMTDEEMAALERENDRERAATKVKPTPSGVIPYPPGSGCIWTGRNGTFNGYGIEVSRLDDKVMMFPFGKRGAGNCTIQFPVSVIPQIIDRLNHYITKTPK